MSFSNFPKDMLNYVGSFLTLKSLLNLKSTCKRFNTIYGPHYNRIKHKIPWKITVHLICDINGLIRIDKGWVIIGKSTDSLEHCEQCYECDYSFLYEGYELAFHGSDEVDTTNVYTIIRKGVGTDMIDNIISNSFRMENKMFTNLFLDFAYEYNLIYNINLSPPDDMSNMSRNDIKFHLPLIVNDMSISDLKYSENYYIDTMYGIHGFMTSNLKKRNRPSNDLGDYDLSRYRDGVFMDIDDSDYDDYY